MEEWQVISLEELQRVLYPRTITMEELRCQDDQVKSSTSDKKPHCRKTRADTNECTTTSEKRPSKYLECMATPKERLKDMLINSDGPEEYSSASEG